MPRVRKHRVRHAYEGSHEICLRGYGGASTRCGIEARTDHGDDAGDDYGDDGGDGEPGEAVEGAWEGAQEGGDGEDAGVEHEAEPVGREGAEGDLTCEELPACSENGEDDGAEGEELAAGGSQKNVACVAHVVDCHTLFY